MGLNRRSIYRWLEAHYYGGEDALKAKPIPGAPSKDQCPSDEHSGSHCQREEPVATQVFLCLVKLGDDPRVDPPEILGDLSEVSVGRLIRRLGFSPQRPLYRAWQQNSALVENWRDEEYTKIAARAKRECAVVFFADESAIRSNYHAGTTWSPTGKTPVVEATGVRFSVNML